MEDLTLLLRKCLTHFILIFLMSSFLLSNADARTFSFKNNCSFPVWFGLLGLGSPRPANGNYRLEANGGTNSVTIPTGTASGVIAGRTNCTSTGCETADCGGGIGACTRGFNQPATQAEFTVQAGSQDFYNLSVINGLNLAVSITPSVASTAANPYFCGSPGAATPSPGLAACTWKFIPPLVEYQWVVPGGAACSSNSTCGAGTVCGLAFNPGIGFRKTCGRLLGYWTANQVCGVQRDYGAPFYCSQALPAPQGNLTRWNLMACVGMGSCYSFGANPTCCGCANWDKLGIPVPPAPTTQQCMSSNPSWTSNVLPTLRWLKTACPTTYTYPYDDHSSTFICKTSGTSQNEASYTITFCPNGSPTPPPTGDTGTIRLAISTASAKECIGAGDSFYLDQDPAGQSFTVNMTTSLSSIVPVGPHSVRLSSTQGVPAPGATGSCTSTLSQTNVTVTKNTTSTVTATYRFQTSQPPTGQYSFNVTLGYPFSKVTINGSQSCPGSSGSTTCLVGNLAVGGAFTISGSSGHICNLVIKTDGSLTTGPNSNYCYINSSPATATRPGFVALPGGF